MLEKIGYPWGIEAKDIIFGLIIAAGISWYFWRRGMASKQIVYAMNVEDLIFHKANLPNEVQITYNDQPIKVLTKIDLYVWNAGNEPIKGEDLLTGDPLRIVWPQGFEVLSSTLLFQTRETNKFELSDFETDSGNHTHLKFAYLNVHDGAAIELIGTRGQPTPTKSRTSFGRLTGEIVGAQRGPILQDYDFSVRRAYIPFAIIGWGIPLYFAWNAYSYYDWYRTEATLWDWLPALGFLPIVVFCTLLGIYAAGTWWQGYRVPLVIAAKQHKAITFRRKMKIYFG